MRSLMAIASDKLNYWVLSLEFNYEEKKQIQGHVDLNATTMPFSIRRLPPKERICSQLNQGTYS
jgi:hypothetical protein